MERRWIPSISWFEVVLALIGFPLFSQVVEPRLRVEGVWAGELMLDGPKTPVALDVFCNPKGEWQADLYAPNYPRQFVRSISVNRETVRFEIRRIGLKCDLRLDSTYPDELQGVCQSEKSAPNGAALRKAPTFPAWAKPTFPPMTPPAPLSPRLRALQEAIRRKGIPELEAFWREMAARGTPLLEPIPGDLEHLWITLLWRAKQPIRQVAIYGGPANNLRPTNGHMLALEGTDVWFKTYQVRKDARFTYSLFPSAEPPIELLKEGSPSDSERFWSREVRDPLNPHTFPEDGYVRSAVELSAAPAQPWIRAKPGTLQGVVTERQFKSQILNNQRSILIYSPPGYEASQIEYPLLILFDGSAYNSLVPTPTILDTLMEAGKTEPLVAALVNSPSQSLREAELDCNELFADFLVREFIPWLRANYRVTRNPTKTMVGGSSAGGLAAAFLALRHPGVFGNVLSQSGFFQWNPAGQRETGWLIRQYASREKLPIRFYLEAGLMEVGRPGSGSVPSILEANRHLRDVLRAKGYEVHYSEFNGGHDYLCWRGSLAEGLLALMGKSVQ